MIRYTSMSTLCLQVSVWICLSLSGVYSAAQVPKPEITPSGIGLVTVGENLTLTCSNTGIPTDIASACKWSKIIHGNDNLIPQIFMFYSTQSGCKKRFGNETIYQYNCQGYNVFTLTILNVQTVWNMTKWICELQIMDQWDSSDTVSMFITEKLAVQLITTPGEVGSIWMNNISTKISNFVELATESYLVSTDAAAGIYASETKGNVWRDYRLVGIIAAVAVICVGIGVGAMIICKRRKHESKQPKQQTRSPEASIYEQLAFNGEELYETLAEK